MRVTRKGWRIQSENQDDDAKRKESAQSMLELHSFPLKRLEIALRKLGSPLTLLLGLAVGVQAQAPGEHDSSLIYAAGGGVKAPVLKQPAPAVFPSDESLRGVRHVCTLEVVIGKDGVPGTIKVVSKPSRFDDEAIAAVRQSQFEAGTSHKKPVAVRIELYVPFGGEPQTQVPLTDVFKGERATPPRALNSVEAEFTEEARRAGITGRVLISLLVNEEGMPINVQIVRSAGYGLDENAITAVRQYRFKPAIMDGIPFTIPITVEVNFQFERNWP